MISLRSKITQNVLSYLFLHPGQTFYLNELARQLKVDSGNLTRKLNELTTEGILQSEVRGNLKYFGLNSKFPLLDEYRRIVQKTVGVEVMLIVKKHWKRSTESNRPICMDLTPPIEWTVRAISMS